MLECGLLSCGKEKCGSAHKSGEAVLHGEEDMIEGQHIELARTRKGRILIDIIHLNDKCLTTSVN